MGIGASQQAHSCDECYACEFRPWREGAAPVGAGEYRIKCGACLPFCEKVNACRARNDREIQAIFIRNLHALGNISVCGTHIELVIIPPVGYE